jgi:hypothetical protein
MSAKRGLRGVPSGSHSTGSLIEGGACASGYWLGGT